MIVQGLGLRLKEKERSGRKLNVLRFEGNLSSYRSIPPLSLIGTLRSRQPDSEVHQGLRGAEDADLGVSAPFGNISPSCSQGSCLYFLSQR